MDKYNLGKVDGMTMTELFNGTAGNPDNISNSGTITLNDKISNYKFLVFDFKVKLYTINRYYYISKIILSEQFLNLIADNNPQTMIDFCWHYTNVYKNENDFFDISSTSTLTSLNYSSRRSQCIRILGIN